MNKKEFATLKQRLKVMYTTSIIDSLFTYLLFPMNYIKTVFILLFSTLFLFVVMFLMCFTHPKKVAAMIEKITR